MNSKNWKCCKIDSICGHSLSRGVVFVGVATLIISIVAMTAALVNVTSIYKEANYNNKPIVAMNMLISLSMSSISLYQIIISLMLVAHKSQYVCSVWFVSHISILWLYSIVFTARAVVSYRVEEYLVTLMTVIAAAIYEGTVIFFVIIVYSYMEDKLDAEGNIRLY